MQLFRFLLLAVAICSAAAAVYDATEECDACRTLTEQFHNGWEEVVRRQASDGRAENKVDAPPTITYNQEIEDYLQGFCDSPRITKYRDYIRKGCKRVMDSHKREVVAKYLSVSEVVGSSMKATRVPFRTREVCASLTSECKRLPAAGEKGKNTKVNKCVACQRVVRDAELTLRRSKKYTDKLKSLDVFEHLETLCPEVYNRYDDDPDTVFKICEKLMENYEEEVLNILAKKEKNAVEQICVQTTDWCAKGDLL